MCYTIWPTEFSYLWRYSATLECPGPAQDHGFEALRYKNYHIWMLLHHMIRYTLTGHYTIPPIRHDTLLSTDITWHLGWFIIISNYCGLIQNDTWYHNIDFFFILMSFHIFLKSYHHDMKDWCKISYYVVLVVLQNGKTIQMCASAITCAHNFTNNHSSVVVAAVFSDRSTFYNTRIVCVCSDADNHRWQV